MRQKIKEWIMGGENFESEFKRQLRIMITVTLGFTIAFTWRQTVFDTMQTFVAWLTNVEGPNVLSILTSTFITVISILFIYLSARFLKDYQ